MHAVFLVGKAGHVLAVLELYGDFSAVGRKFERGSGEISGVGFVVVVEM